MNSKTQEDYHPFKSLQAREKFLEIYADFEKQWPVRSGTKMVDTSYGKTFVRISGSDKAAPLVLLHGMGSNSLMGWLTQVEELSENFKTYAVDDICGFGKSICTKPVKSPGDYVEWLNELLYGLGLNNGVNLMGMSYGAWQTALYALNRPERLNRIVMLAPPVLPCGLQLKIRAYLGLLPHGYFYKSLLRWLFEDLVKKDREYAEEAIDLLIQVSKCFTPVRLPDPTLLSDMEFAAIKVPALYVIGENDKIYPARKAIKRINNVAPQIKTELIPGAGHDMPAVKPDLINKLVIDFLTQ